MLTSCKLRTAMAVRLVVAGAILVAGFQAAEARPQYRVQFIKQYRNVKEANSDAMNCLLCHEAKEGSESMPDTKQHNNYGSALKDIIQKNERKPEKIEQALRDVESSDSATKGQSFGDLLKDGKLPASRDEALAIIERGINALGGRDALNRSKASTWKEQGTYYGMGDGLPYTGEYATEWPGKFKMIIQGVFTIVLNGEQGWSGTAGMVLELTGDDLAEQQEQNHSRSVVSLLFVGDKGYILEKLADAELDGRPAAAVKVTHEKHRDVTLFFDKQSGLLVKAEYRLKSPEHAGREVTEEAFLRNYREIDGLQVATKLIVHRDGQKFVETDLTEMKFAEKLDPSVFAKPQ